MEHQFQLVDICDKGGNVIGSKQRRELNKKQDIYHAVYIFLVTPRGEIAFSIIPPREDLPNLYVNQYGATMATIRRTNETSKNAAARGVARELFIEHATPELIGEGLEKTDDGRLTYMSVFTLHSEMPDSYSLLDIERLDAMTRQQFEELLRVEPKRAAPTLRVIWEKYSDKLLT